MLFATSSFLLGAALWSALLAGASPANLEERAAPLAQVITKCTVPNKVALTFDDGPYNYIYVRAFFFPPKLFRTLSLYPFSPDIEYLKSID
jgi:peptidoglycan/xylan/chitin deacetylase (PgdA/CDA1 family)